MSDDERATKFRPRDAVGAPRGDTFVLSVVKGLDSGATFHFDGSYASRALVGQSAICDLRLQDSEVSRRHAALEIHERTLRVNDLGSKSGTFVHGLRIGEAFLVGGEVLRMGSTLLQVTRGPMREVSIPLRTGFGRMLGASLEMRRLYPLCERLAASNIAVIIEGETGTGKEVLAECLHDASTRADRPFVVFDCTTVAPSLLEAELFGHERGAFTGAVSMRKGVFERAEGGTLFIDEIGDLDVALQAKLLRAIDRGEIRRVGGDRTLKVDVRILCATRRDLDRSVQLGSFRDDLFHRLSVGRIELPPLRRRRGDIPILARHFARAAGGAEDALSPQLLLEWETRPWPGNVRELRNAVTRHVTLGELANTSFDVATEKSGDEQGEEEGGTLFASTLALGLSLAAARQRVVDAFERRYLNDVLERHGGNVTQAAAASGIARRHFYRVRARTTT